MQFKDISQDKENLYTLKENEQCVFFMFNRSGEITFELTETGAEAHIFAFFIGKNDNRGNLAITQKHTAPKTTSHTLVKSALFDTSKHIYTGLISIGEQAVKSDASQENRALLLSPLAQASSNPSLEILTNDVICRHAATAHPLNQEALFFAQSRGLSPVQAKKLLIQGFFNEAIQKIQAFKIDTTQIEKEMSTLLETDTIKL